MNETTRRLMVWTPRVLCIAFAAFLSVFALDAFGTAAGFWDRALALSMHLVPTGVVLAALTIVWRREWVGAIAFPLLMVFHLVTMRGRLDWTGYALIDGPLLIMGALFWINWRNRATLRQGIH